MDSGDKARNNNEAMIETKDITKMVKHIARRDSGKSDATIMHPMREWALGLFVTAFIVLWGVIFTVALYRVYGSSLETEVPVAVTVIPYKAPLVADAIQFYEKERTIYEAMLRTGSVLGKSNVSLATTTMGETVSSSIPVIQNATSSPETVPVLPLVVKESSKPVVPMPAL